MLSEKEAIRISKFLSLVLRHQPDMIGLAVDENGWADVEELLQKMERKGVSLTCEILRYIVDTNNKKRFAVSADGTKIRASQGHSIAVDLGYAERVPPPVLYHGTAEKYVRLILQEGLRRKKRQHVHLSADKETAVAVGQRHGKPVLFEVEAEKMHGDGYVFCLSANAVWLTEGVPAKYLQLL